MITNFDFFCENYQTGPITLPEISPDKPLTIRVEETEAGNRVYLVFDLDVFKELSVIIPASKKLEASEFYMAADIDPHTIAALKAEGFITETGKTAPAGENQVKSYNLSV